MRHFLLPSRIPITRPTPGRSRPHSHGTWRLFQGTARGVFLAAGLALGVSVAIAGDLEKLTSSSPFAPLQGPAAGNAGDNTPLEFQGEFFFSIYDPAAKNSAWVGLNEPGRAFTVRSYDEAKVTIVADFKGRSLTLSLKKAPIVPTVPDPTMPTVTLPTAGAPAVTAVPTSEEAKRLANLAAEIRRRRAMRQQVAPPANAVAPSPSRNP
jgi:hypothetical protein